MKTRTVRNSIAPAEHSTQVSRTNAPPSGQCTGSTYNPSRCVSPIDGNNVHPSPLSTISRAVSMVLTSIVVRGGTA